MLVPVLPASDSPAARAADPRVEAQASSGMSRADPGTAYRAREASRRVRPGRRRANGSRVRVGVDLELYPSRDVVGGLLAMQGGDESGGHVHARRHAGGCPAVAALDPARLRHPGHVPSLDRAHSNASLFEVAWYPSSSPHCGQQRRSRAYRGDQLGHLRPGGQPGQNPTSACQSPGSRCRREPSRYGAGAPPRKGLSDNFGALAAAHRLRRDPAVRTTNSSGSLLSSSTGPNTAQQFEPFE